MAAAGDPAQLYLARVRNYECDQDGEERDEAERQGVEAGAVAVSAQPLAAGLDTVGVRQCLLWGRFDLHGFSFSWRGGHVG